MDAVELIGRLHRHRMWVNQALRDAAAVLSDEALRRPFAIGQGSIWKSLLHLYGGEYVWLEALLGDPDPLLPGDLPRRLPGNQMGEGGITELSDLRQRWSALDARWLSYLESLRPEALDETVFKRSTSSGFDKVWGTRRADILLHVCTHAHYTAAQVVNMLRQAGASNLPDCMLITLARESIVELYGGDSDARE